MRLDREQLPLVIPFIKCCRLIEALIALQPDQFGVVHGGQRLGDLGLADARLAFEQQRTPQQLHQRDRGREFAIGDIAGRRQRLRDLLAGLHCQSVFLFAASSPSPAKRWGGVGGSSAGTAASVNAAPPPTPDPSPPRARARGGRAVYGVIVTRTRPGSSPPSSCASSRAASGCGWIPGTRRRR